MDRNIRLYPLYLACRRLIFWLPVFFLYFSSVLRIDQVLLLEAIYYLGVVVLEVPSGYFSDRVGRRVTLLISTGSWIVGGLVFVMTASFVPFAVAQLLLALGMAFNSGTDTALLYDSLKDQGREDELARQEARAQALGLVAVGIAAGVGGLLAGFDLRIAYLLSSLSAALAWAVAWHFREPPRSDVVRPPVRQIVAASQRLRDPQLRWIFVFVVGMTVLNHVPYEFFQPWLELLLKQMDRPGYAVTPGAAGLLIALSMAISAPVSARAPQLQERFGTRRALLGVLTLQGIVVCAMGVAVHPVVVPFLLLRSVAQALITPITRAVIHPRIDSSMRATYLSLQSFAGRLVFAGCLAVTSLWIGGVETLEHPLMREVLAAYALGAVLLAVLLSRSGPEVPSTTD